MTELIVDSNGTTKSIEVAKSAIATDGGLWGGWWGGGTAGRNQDLVSNKWGAASAYLLVPSVNRAVNLISDALNALTWEIVKNTTPDTDKDADEVVAKSTDVRPRHPLAEAIKRGRKYTKQPLLSSICYSELLYGMVLLEPIPAMSKDRYLALRWLNPLGVSITVSRGRIDRFFYSGMAGAEPSDYFDPSEVAYTHNFNPYDDFRGRGVLEVAMDDINISRNLKRFVQAFFRNNARPSFAVSPDKPGETWSELDVEKIRRHLANNFQGSDEAFTTMIIQKAMSLTPFEQPNPGEQYEINAELRREIYTIFGVPIAMAGDTEGTSYQNPKETLDWFFLNTIAPLADKIASYFNDEVLPFFDESGDYRFRFDTSEFDFVSVDDNIRSEVADRNFRNGLWTLNQSLVYTKQDAIEGGDYRLVDGVPVPDSEVLTYWQHKLLIAPSVYNSEIVTGKPLPQPAAPNEVIPTETGGEPVSDAPPQEPAENAPEAPQKAVQDTPEAELAAWLKVALKSHKRAFEPIHLRGDFGDWLSEAVLATNGEPDAIKALFGEAKDRLTVKAVQATRIDFEDAFAASLSEALAGNITRRRWSTIVRSLISRYGNMAYRDGLKDGGVDAEPDEAEQQQITDLIREQSQYVTNLGAKLFKDEDTVSPAMADQKPAMWWNKSLLPFYAAGEISANGNAMKEFAGPDGEESCDTCMRLKGQRHRLKDWDRRQLYPGKDTHNYECGGWQCEHTLVNVKGKERGNWLG